MVRDGWLRLKRVESRKKAHTLCEVAGVGGGGFRLWKDDASYAEFAGEREKLRGDARALWWHCILPPMGGLSKPPPHGGGFLLIEIVFLNQRIDKSKYIDILRPFVKKEK